LIARKDLPRIEARIRDYIRVVCEYHLPYGGKRLADTRTRIPRPGPEPVLRRETGGEGTHVNGRYNGAGFYLKRFPFLDWMRGLAILVMIQCHTFNSFTRSDLRDGGPYVLTQFVGGMAAPLFLFMAGMTMAFQMESLERRETNARRRWAISLRRAGYILGIAFAFRFTNWLFSMPHASVAELTRVDILNCMGVGMVALAVAAIFPGAARIRFGLLAGMAIMGVAPLIANLDWSGTPGILQEYIAPAANRRFPFFPWVAYLAFGLSLGTIVKRTAMERFERLMQWSVLIGFAMIFTGQYFSYLPYSIYTKSNFWLDSPALIVIRTGIILLAMAGAFLWTEHGASTRWSWMQALGKNSLMVYWVHVMMVYGSAVRPLKRALSIGMAGLATIVVTLMMIALSAGWLWWKGKRAGSKTALRSSPDLEPARTEG
jgi:uncharacterized membrane protein